MTIKEFINKAIEGGWKYPNAVHVFEVGYNRCKYCNVQRVVVDRRQKVLQRDDKSGGEVVEVTENRYDMEGGPCELNPIKPIIERIFLDPTAWRAVSKVEGWKPVVHLGELIYPEWQYNMHRMVDALAEGKSLEAFISTL